MQCFFHRLKSSVLCHYSCILLSSDYRTSFMSHDLPLLLHIGFWGFHPYMWLFSFRTLLWLYNIYTVLLYLSGSIPCHNYCLFLLCGIGWSPQRWTRMLKTLAWVWWTSWSRCTMMVTTRWRGPSPRLGTSHRRREPKREICEETFSFILPCCVLLYVLCYMCCCINFVTINACMLIQINVHAWIALQISNYYSNSSDTCSHCIA